MQSPVELPIDTDKPLQKFNDKLHSVYAKAHLKLNKPNLLNVINHLGTENGLIKISPRCTLNL